MFIPIGAGVSGSILIQFTQPEVVPAQISVGWFTRMALQVNRVTQSHEFFVVEIWCHSWLVPQTWMRVEKFRRVKKGQRHVNSPGVYAGSIGTALREFPQKLPGKLKQIRDRSGLTADDFAPRVNAKDGKTIKQYESGNGELPVSVLMGYWKLGNVPLENLMNDDRDLWFGHRVN